IKVLSIEDVSTGEEELVAMAKQDASQVAAQEGPCEGAPTAAPAEGAASEPAPVGEGLDLQQPEADPYEDDEWVSAGALKGVAETHLLFDKQGKVAKELSSGLSLINPIDREREIDLNYSSAKGYHDLYSSRPAPGTAAPEAFVEPETFVEPDAFVEPETGPLKVQGASPPGGVDVVDASTMIGQPCGLGDGDISTSDSKVFVCRYCKSAFHEGCARVVLEVEGGRCPSCDASWV
ncbi:MAG: hypothetical protein JW839_00375, partial [Candidatus Lokiarchaeota archaeon]|nr:hypothetical protein [Candidatus Lokiarchaeota archaeon]